MLPSGASGYSPLGESVTAGIECMLGSAMYLKSTGMSLKNKQTEKEHSENTWRGVKRWRGEQPAATPQSSTTTQKCDQCVFLPSHDVCVCLHQVSGPFPLGLPLKLKHAWDETQLEQRDGNMFAQTKDGLWGTEDCLMRNANPSTQPKRMHTNTHTRVCRSKCLLMCRAKPGKKQSHQISSSELQK